MDTISFPRAEQYGIILDTVQRFLAVELLQPYNIGGVSHKLVLFHAVSC